MTSYLKSIFWGRDNTNHTKSSAHRIDTSSSRSNESRSPSCSGSPTKSKHFKYVYAEPGNIPPAPIQTITRERSNSLIPSRTIAPSPLRYTLDNNSHGARSVYPHHLNHHPTHSLDGANSNVPLYRSSSHRTERRMCYYNFLQILSASQIRTIATLMQRPAFNPTDSFSSVRSSTQSMCSNNPAPHHYAPSRASSSGSVATQSTGHEPKSVLKHNPSGADNSKSGRRTLSIFCTGALTRYFVISIDAHVSFQNPNRLTPVHMHPLLCYGRIQRAPISFDVIYPPSTRTVVDRHTHSPIPSLTLTQPATEPPTYGRFVLKCEKLPWYIIATTGVDISGMTTGHSSGKRFYIGSATSTGSGRSRSSSSSGNSPEAITNLDVLYAIHATLSVRVTQAEWNLLGNGSRAQRKATRAYEKRCTDMGGGWGAGVRRVDFLGGKTKLVGVEIANERVAGDTITIGKPVFCRPWEVIIVQDGTCNSIADITRLGLFGNSFRNLTYDICCSTCVYKRC